MMNTHVYSFDGEMYLQTAGGPIGLRSMCAVARITMSTWDARWKNLLNQNNVKVMAAGRYMDDPVFHEVTKTWLEMAWRLPMLH
jgi:hypothetical protein